jgi:serine/threonine protein kinase
MADEIGRLGHYRVLRALGQGGMGVVFLAEDSRLSRLVALKVMLPSMATSDAARTRFLREARAAAAVEHEHIVPIYQVDEGRGVPYIAMPFLKGASLEERLRQVEKLPLAEVLRIGREAAQGLAAAHAAGLIHRDIKPDNIWLEGDAGKVKLLDFGLARAARDDAGLTQQGAIIGTPAYMAPEQAQGEPLDARADLFSLGCVLYRACCGRQPFQKGDILASVLAVISDHPPSLTEVDPAVPPPLSNLVMQMLAKLPGSRPASAEDVARTLREIEKEFLQSTEDGEAHEGKHTDDSKKPSRKKARGPTGKRPKVSAPVLVSGLVGLALIFLAGLAYFSGLGRSGAGAPGSDGNTRRDSPASAPIVEPSTTPKKLPPPTDDPWVAKARELKGEDLVKAVSDRLRELNPKFDGDLHPFINEGKVVEISLPAGTLSNIGPVAAFVDLQRLSASGPYTGFYANDNKLADLTPLKGLPLQKITATVMPLSNLSFVNGMPLQYLDIRATKVIDLEPLRGVKLRYLDIAATPVKSLAPLEKMPLVHLDCWTSRGIHDLAPLRGARLEVLNVERTGVKDLGPLAGMPLKRLSCGYTRVEDIAPLVSAPLQELWLGETQVARIDILKGMPLKKLGVQKSRVTDLSPIRDSKLELIQCNFDPVRDTPILRSIPTLTSINGVAPADFWRQQGIKP